MGETMKHIKGDHMTVRMVVTPNGDFEYYTATDLRIPTMLIAEVGSELAQKLLERFNEYEYDVTLLTDEYVDRQRWNFQNHGKGKDWPVFDRMDKFIERRMLEAGLLRDA